MKKTFNTKENNWYNNLSLLLHGQTFPLVPEQVCTHCRSYFSPPFHNKSSPDLLAFEAVAGQQVVSATSGHFLLGSGDRLGVSAGIVYCMF